MAVGDQAITLSASYLDDALSDLVLATRLLLEGSDLERVSWAEEPGEYRWVLERDGDDLRIRILTFDDLWSGLPDSAGAEQFDATCPLDAFRAAVAAGARRVLDEHGARGYREKWIEHEFPTEDLAALEAGT